MVFSSLVFLWIFLPALLIVYYLSRERFFNVILFAASMFFYAWGEPFYVLLMAASIIFNYAAGLSLKSKKRAGLFLIIGITGNLLLLGYYKYADFFTANINAVFGSDFSLPGVVLPIGISFYTFQSISYLVDIYRREVEPQENIIKMGLYISLFPSLIAGPIIKYHDINRQINSRHVSLEKFNAGVGRFITGLSKKVLIANVVAKTADAVFALPGDQFTSGTAWVGIFAYTLQIYFDFSGYSDMAIGLSKMFGFEIKENFDHPYVSRSIQEFWRRWHISLSTWFKEYLYIPLGGNRKGSARTYINLLIVFFATGLWHGASWNFVLWGMYHGAFLVLERAAGMGKVTGFKILRTFYTLLVVLSGWVIFRAETLGQAARYLKNMFSFNFGADALLYLNKELIIVFAVGILASGFIQQAHGAAVKNKIYKYCFTWARPMALSVFLFFCVLYMANNTYNPFIYFRF